MKWKYSADMEQESKIAAFSAHIDHSMDDEPILEGYVIQFGSEANREYLVFSPQWQKGRVLRFVASRQAPEGDNLETLFDDTLSVTDEELEPIAGTTRFRYLIKVLFIDMCRLLARKHGGKYNRSAYRDVEKRLQDDLQAAAEAWSGEGDS